MTKPTCDCEYCRRRPTAEDRVRIGDKLLNEQTQRELLGSVSHMWLRRRAKNVAFCFPEARYQGRRAYRWASDLAAWAESPHAAMKTARQFPEARDADAAA